MPNLTVSGDVDSMLASANDAAIRSAIGVGQTDSPTFLAQTLTGQSLTGTQATSLVDLSATWNTTGTPSALKLNITDTASNAASLLMDLRVGGVSKASITKGGQIASGFGYTYAQPQFYDSTIGVSAGFQCKESTGVALYGSGSAMLGVDNIAANGIRVASHLVFGWTGGHALSGAPDLALWRDAAGILAQRNGTNAQAFRVANSVGASPLVDYDRGVFDFKTTTNTLRIGTENGGTYTTARPVDFVTGGVARWQISAAGNFIAPSDATYDIGASGANRPKDIYAAGMISSVGYIRSTAGYRFLQGGSYFVESANGVLKLTDSGLADFGRLQLGGTTSAFPAIKRNGTGIDIKLADDSAFAPLSSGSFSSDSSISAGGGSYIMWSGGTSSRMFAPSNGVIQFTNAATTGFTRLELGSTNLGISRGTGSPEGVVTALVGSLYIRTDGGASTTLYVKESSPTPSTGWVAK